MRLADFYYKEKEFDKAWQYLNDIQYVYPELKSKIDVFRTRILKKEKKYKDALFYLMSANLFNSNGGRNQDFNVERLKKDLSPILKKLNMYDNEKYFKSIIDIINEALKAEKNPYKCEEILRNRFKAFIDKYEMMC